LIGKKKKVVFFYDVHTNFLVVTLATFHILNLDCINPSKSEIFKK